MGVMAPEHAERRAEIVDLLTKAYWMEIETVMSYIANSTNPDGVRAQEIIEALAQDIQEELGHAQEFARRIHELHGRVPARRRSRPSRATFSRPTTRRTSSRSSTASSRRRPARSSTTRGSSRRATAWTGRRRTW